MDKLKKVLSGEDEDNNADGTGILERTSQAATLAWGTRMKGFLLCFILGLLCSILGTCMLWLPGLGLIVFAVLYSVGNLCALASTMFLIGPCRQLKNMCAKERALATIIMLVCLVLTLCSAFLWKSNGLALLFCVLQFVAFSWYGLSYIPFARDAIIKLCSVCF
ncbi:vesicle transport protein SFT2B-like isoform X2 [Phyllopteryx taeniolatus]|uniref:vesicle transport protein SFT2B-like isoform X2 n=1 Tax=Phyllopteryx taeniolatus TaxID=161469 RepID=UPI002AD2AE34|nr:vesicle transport protein SFT2B-like isoform X2 [Phyllopteryx taeniolatus]